MWKPIALVCIACVLALTPFALADEGQSTTTPTQPTTAEPCTPMKELLSWRNWEDPHPLAGANPCSSPNGRELMAHFFMYRAYRKVTPYRCQSGKFGTWAIPCSIISCESGFSWSAANPSGAVGPYQLLGWRAPYPARTFGQRVANHRIAASVWAGGSGRSNWVC